MRLTQLFVNRPPLAFVFVAVVVLAGAYALNLWRAKLLAPQWSEGAARRVAENHKLPAPLRALARAQVLDAAYVSTLRAALQETTH